MSRTAETVAATVATELESAQAKFDPMNSAHEGWAVILEEVDELNEDVETIQNGLRVMWPAVRGDDRNTAREAAQQIADAAERAAVEAIQTAAMARRFLVDLPGVTT